MHVVRSLLLIACSCASLTACGDDDQTGSAGTDPSRDGGSHTGSGPICASDGACEHSVKVGEPQHFEGDINYTDKPPAGGPHNPCWASYGVHEDPVRPENWVHNLEHGAVVYLYNCPDGCADDIAALSDFVRDGRPRALLTPYADMEHRFAVVSWGERLETDELDLDAFAKFYAEHHDHGLESISSGPPSGC